MAVTSELIILSQADCYDQSNCMATCNELASFNSGSFLLNEAIFVIGIQGYLFAFFCTL